MFKQREKNNLYNHIATSHEHWKDILLPSDSAIDATCGNGHDTLFLAKLLPLGKLFCFDIQKKAIINTFSILKEKLGEKNLKNVFFINDSHIDFSAISKSSPIKLIVYNLGYLPGGDKTITTKTSSSLVSIENALKTIIKGGAISITCYPGHFEGLKESEAITNMLSSLDPKDFNIISYRHPNKKTAPHLFFIKKH